VQFTTRNRRAVINLQAGQVPGCCAHESRDLSCGPAYGPFESGLGVWPCLQRVDLTAALNHRGFKIMDVPRRWIAGSGGGQVGNPSAHSGGPPSTPHRSHCGAPGNGAILPFCLSGRLTGVVRFASGRSCSSRMRRNAEPFVRRPERLETCFQTEKSERCSAISRADSACFTWLLYPPSSRRSPNKRLIRPLP